MPVNKGQFKKSEIYYNLTNIFTEKNCFKLTDRHWDDMDFVCGCHDGTKEMLWKVGDPQVK